jgi:hypothetical protein
MVNKVSSLRARRDLVADVIDRVRFRFEVFRNSYCRKAVVFLSFFP